MSTSVRISFAPSGAPSSCATSCETPTFAMTNALGARSRTTAYVRRKLGSRSAARWLPTPIPRPCRAAASASVSFTRSAPEWPPVMPAIRSGSASVCPRRRAERSMFAASVAGSASCTRCTSSHPGARLDSTSSSAAMRRCSALRRSMAAPSRAGAPGPRDGLLEDAIALESAPFVERQAEDLPEDVIVVRPQGRPGAVLPTRRRGQPERGRHEVHLADGRMRHGRPHPTVRELRVAEQLRDREHGRDPKALAAEHGHDLIAIARPSPRADALVQLRARGAPFRRGRRAVYARDLTKTAPVRIVPDTERDPAVRAGTAIDAVRRGDGVGVAAATRYSSVRGELEDRRREELQPGLVLREVDGAAHAGAPPPLDRREYSDRAVTDRDVVDVGPIEKDGGRVGLAEQLDESRERAQLAAVARVERVRSGLALVATREDDQPRVIGAERLRSEAEPRDGPRGEALDEHIGGADERPREGDPVRVLQVERRAALAVVIESEHRRAIGRDDAVLEWRVRRSEDIGGEATLEADDLGAEVREILADERARGGKTQLHHTPSPQRPRAGAGGPARPGLPPTTPAARRRASSSGPTPAAPKISALCSPMRGARRRTPGRSSSKCAKPH